MTRVKPAAKATTASEPPHTDMKSSAPRSGIWLPLTILAALAVAMFVGVLFTTKDLVPSSPTADLAQQYVFQRAFGFGELAKGHLALWNPYIFSGVPFFGGFQAALLYPPNFIFLILPLAKAVSWSVALHVFLFGAFTFLWVWRRGLHPWAAFIAAATMMFCGTHFPRVYAGHLSNLCTMTWAPLIFMVIDGLLEDRNVLRWLLIGILAVAMQIFAGHPQYVFFTGIASVVYAGCCAIRLPNRWRFLGAVAVIYIGGALLSAVQLFTGFDDWREMARESGVPYEVCASFSFPPENILTAFAPGFFGDVVHTAYWGRSLLWEASIFIGAVSLCLAAIGATSADKNTRRFSRIMVVVFLLLAIGGHIPGLYELLYYAVPGFNKFRGPGKFAMAATLFLAMLAAIGLSELLHGRRLSLKFIGSIGAISICLLLGGVFVYESGHGGSTTSFWHSFLSAINNTNEVWVLDRNMYDSPEFIYQSAAAASKSLVIAAVMFGAVALLLYLQRRGPSRWPLVCLVALSVIETGYAASRTFATFSVAADSSPTLKRLVESDPGDYRVLNLNFPDEAMVVGARDIWGYDAAIPSRYCHVLALTQGLDPDLFPSYVDVTEVTNSLVGMFRCKYLIFDEPSKKPPQVLTNYLPHALLVPNYRVIPKRKEMFGALLDPAFNPHAEVLLESAPSKFSLRPASKPSSVSAPPPGTVKIESETTDTLTFEIDARAPSILLVTDTYARNWRVTALPGSSQQQYELLPANHCLRAVPLEAGHHRLKMEYLPLGFQIGKWVSLVSTIVFLGCVVWCIVPIGKRKAVMTSV